MAKIAKIVIAQRSGSYVSCTVEEMAQAMADADPRTLADFLEALGMRLGMIAGASQFLGGELRRLAREQREELSEVTLTFGRPKGS